MKTVPPAAKPRIPVLTAILDVLLVMALLFVVVLYAWGGKELLDRWFLIWIVSTFGIYVSRSRFRLKVRQVGAGQATGALDPVGVRKKPITIPGLGQLGDRLTAQFNGHPMRMLVAQKLRKSRSGKLSEAPESLAFIQFQFATHLKLILSLRDLKTSPLPGRGVLSGHSRKLRGSTPGVDLVEAYLEDRKLNETFLILTNSPQSPVLSSPGFHKVLELVAVDPAFVRLQIGPENDITRAEYLRVDVLSESSHSFEPGIGIIRESESPEVLTQPVILRPILEAMVQLKTEIQQPHSAGPVPRGHMGGIEVPGDPGPSDFQFPLPAPIESAKIEPSHVSMGSLGHLPQEKAPEDQSIDTPAPAVPVQADLASEIEIDLENSAPLEPETPNQEKTPSLELLSFPIKKQQD